MKNIFIPLIFASFISGVLHAQEKTDRFDIQTINGKTLQIVSTENGLKIPQHKGKILFLEFWGTHCPPCLMSIPHYIDLQKKYKKDLAIVAVEVQATPKNKLIEFVRSKGINYDVVSYMDGAILTEYIAQIANWKGSIPLLVIVDQAGEVQIVQPGMIAQEALEQVIEELISKKAKTPAAKEDTNRTKK